MILYVDPIMQAVAPVSILYGLNLLLIIAVIFFERKTSTATFAWIMVLAFLPIVGFILYMVFNQNLSRLKINKMLDNEESFHQGFLTNQINAFDEGKIAFSDKNAENWKQLVKLNQVYGGSIYTQNNDVELIVDSNRYLDMLLEDISKAKHTLDVEFFIIKNDFVGKKIINLLTEKAKEGVQVRLLVDALGSRKINNRVLKEYLEAGGKVGYFFKPKLKFLKIRLNYRNHRKIVVIDDTIGYTGGCNIAREYIGHKRKFGNWRDTNIRIKGAAVIELKSRFVLDWRFTTSEQMNIVINDNNTENVGKMGVQIVSCGPESSRQEVKRAMMKMITSAQKSIFIQTPYFVPDQSILESLKMASLSGIDVRLMVPCKPDHIFVYWATYSNLAELIKDGVKVYIYDNGFIHAKTMVCDGEAGTIGSTNFDNRSFKLNFETNAFVYDTGFAKQMEASFEADMIESHELTPELYKNRGIKIKFKEQISRLFMDIL